jgi:hypothetical protein
MNLGEKMDIRHKLQQIGNERLVGKTYKEAGIGIDVTREKDWSTCPRMKKYHNSVLTELGLDPAQFYIEYDIKEVDKSNCFGETIDDITPSFLQMKRSYGFIEEYHIKNVYKLVDQESFTYHNGLIYQKIWYNITEDV